jgi:hypothetical protein
MHFGMRRLDFVYPAYSSATREQLEERDALGDTEDYTTARNRYTEHMGEGLGYAAELGAGGRNSQTNV